MSVLPNFPFDPLRLHAARVSLHVVTDPGGIRLPPVRWATGLTIATRQIHPLSAQRHLRVSGPIEQASRYRIRNLTRDGAAEASEPSALHRVAVRDRAGCVGIRENRPPGHSPEAVIHSPGATVAAWPTTVTNSRWPRARVLSTQKPFSGLWKVTRSTGPARTSRSGDRACRPTAGFTTSRAPER